MQGGPKPWGSAKEIQRGGRVKKVGEQGNKKTRKTDRGEESDRQP